MRKPRFDYENESCNQMKQNQQEVTLKDIADLLKNLTQTLKVRSRSNSRERTNMSERECFKCHEKGHIAPNCPSRDKENKLRLMLRPINQSVHIQANNTL
ncbi:hypothetical protein DPMN_128289 [Dreissena polymorpha]|uniref:CCHC-type domain-containing protein n=1 Tax=Dreissena polymorpha TaxID=45954 RepID=A0A9D4JVL5_DREPO|nr:hypothetical protein DPMN_128289 [Dreissena polymorpha]